MFYRRIKYKYEFGYVWIKSRVRLIIIICDTQVCYYCVSNAINGRSNLCPDQILLWIVLTNTPNDHTYKQYSFINLNSILRMIWFRTICVSGLYVINLNWSCQQKRSTVVNELAMHNNWQEQATSIAYAPKNTTFIYYTYIE